MSIDPVVLKLAIERVVEAVHPSEIIAFGSRARGTARPDSDVDLLVLLPGTFSVKARFNKAVDLHELLADMPFSKDILVGDFEWRQRLDELAPVYRTAVREGISLWQAGSLMRRPCEDCVDGIAQAITGC